MVGEGSGAQENCCPSGCWDGENPSLVMEDEALLVDMLDDGMAPLEFWKEDVVVVDDADGSAGYGGRLDDALDRSMGDEYGRWKGRYG
jgi:hypothetical protein